MPASILQFNFYRLCGTGRKMVCCINFTTLHPDLYDSSKRTEMFTSTKIRAQEIGTGTSRSTRGMKCEPVEVSRL